MVILNKLVVVVVVFFLTARGIPFFFVHFSGTLNDCFL